MNWTIIILAVLICFCNSTQDEIRFHWDRTFGKWFKPDTFWYDWMNPAVSWANKYWSKNPVVRFLFSTVLVWTTDLWHLLKAIIINAVFVAFLIVTGEPWVWYRWIIILAVLNVLWGILFELFIGIYGALGDRK